MLLGCYDLLRGTMHSFKIEYESLNISHLNILTPESADLLHFLGLFGVSNYVTGIMLVLISIKARGLALIMLGIIPFFYSLGMLAIKVDTSDYAEFQAAWGGLIPMIIYLSICVIAFIAGVIGTIYNKNNDD
ncbi:MAG: hypothetical protein K0U10_04530 [Gammaproteobacteria bacterium]|nr:hypothetical protein [Gammaproteobacteria bacterium]